MSDRCAESLHPFVDKDLSEEEWHKFCELVQALPEELKEIMHKFGQRRGDPTRNWRRRQQRKARRDRDKNNNNTDGRNKEKGKGDDKRKDNNNNNKRRDDSSRRRKDDCNRRDGDCGPRENNRDRRNGNNRRPWESSRREGDHHEKDTNGMTGRQCKSFQAKELQMAYRRGAKRCVEKILGDVQERRQCGIPPKAIHEQMTKSYSTAGRGPDKPAWIADPDREKTDVLDAPLMMDEVRRQLRRLPAFSASGPDGTTYTSWKRLDPEDKLLTTIMNVCRKAARVPPSWKMSTTVLAYKNKGDEKELRNWRPIYLQNTSIRSTRQ